MYGQVTRYAYQQTLEAVSEVMLWEYNKSQICSCISLHNMLLLERWQLKCMVVYRCLQRPMYILLTTLHNQLCHPLSTCKQSPEALQAKHPISVPADCRDCELRNIITFPLFIVSILDTTWSSHTTLLFTNWQLLKITLHWCCYLNMVCIATVAVPYRGGDAPTKISLHQYCFLLMYSSCFVVALLVWLSFGLKMKYGVCVVCGTLCCTYFPTKFGVGPLLPPHHLLIIKHGHTMEWRTCNWVT